MEKKLPIRKLLRLDILLAIIVSSIVYLALSMDKQQHNALLFSVMGIISIFLIGLSNIIILYWLHKEYGLYPKKIKLYRYLLSYPISVAIYLLIFPIFAGLSEESWSYMELETLLVFIISGSMVNTLVIILNDLVMLQNEKMNAELELSKIKAANAEAEILLLRQQIHPHFLFNALNTLKSLYKVDTKIGDTYMVHLANFLRASIFDRNAEVSSLEDELKLLGDYLEMQKIRFGTALYCSIDTQQADGKGFCLPAFSLQPLLENAIKHNELTEEDPLHVEIQVNSGMIWVKNNLQVKKNIEKSTNSGLANLSERCKLLSGNEIEISLEDGKFMVGIILLTDEYNNHRR